MSAAWPPRWSISAAPRPGSARRREHLLYAADEASPFPPLPQRARSGDAPVDNSGPVPGGAASRALTVLHCLYINVRFRWRGGAGTFRGCGPPPRSFRVCGPPPQKERACPAAPRRARTGNHNVIAGAHQARPGGRGRSPGASMTGTRAGRCQAPGFHCAPGHSGSRAPGHSGSRAPGHSGSRAPGHSGSRAPGHSGSRAPGHPWPAATRRCAGPCLRRTRGGCRTGRRRSHPRAGRRASPPAARCGRASRPWSRAGQPARAARRAAHPPGLRGAGLGRAGGAMGLPRRAGVLVKVPYARGLRGAARLRWRIAGGYEGGRPPGWLCPCRFRWRRRLPGGCPHRS